MFIPESCRECGEQNFETQWPVKCTFGWAYGGEFCKKYFVSVKAAPIEIRRCRVCGCTDNDCTKCIERTGDPCWWVEEDFCSACQLSLGDIIQTASYKMKCCHKNTYMLPDPWPTGEDIEVCNCCGLSRAHWEQGESSWVVVDLVADRKQLQLSLNDMEKGVV